MGPGRGGLLGDAGEGGGVGGRAALRLRVEDSLPRLGGTAGDPGRITETMVVKTSIIFSKVGSDDG